ISAHNDFVNILLIPIAGRRYFINNNQDGYMAHSGIPLLTDNEFDENGNFAASSYRKQSFATSVLEGFLANGVILLDQLPKGTNEKVVALLGSIISGMLTSDQSITYETMSVCQGIIDFRGFLTQTVSEGYAVQYTDVSYADEQLLQAKYKISDCLNRLRDATQLMCADFYTIKFSKLLIYAVIRKLEYEEKTITKAWEVLSQINQIYQICETEIMKEIQT
ncbi:MAG: hypothetical protein GX567_04680, partial [Clostridia bacterium]|nr:hypothetical protein [Clostridia bacterium]